MTIIDIILSVVLLPALAGIALWYLLDCVANIRRTKRAERYYVVLWFFCLMVIGTSTLHIVANTRIEKMEKENENAAGTEVPALTDQERAILLQMYRFGWYISFSNRPTQPGAEIWSRGGLMGEILIGNFQALKHGGHILSVAVCGRRDIYLANPDRFSISGRLPDTSQFDLKFVTTARETPPGAPIPDPIAESTEKGE